MRRRFRNSSSSSSIESFSIMSFIDLYESKSNYSDSDSSATSYQESSDESDSEEIGSRQTDFYFPISKRDISRQKFLKKLKLKRKNCVYAGGFVAYLAGMTSTYNDIDKFVSGKITDSDAMKYNQLKIFERWETIVAGQRIDNIKMCDKIYPNIKSKESISKLLAGFDQNITRFALYFDEKDRQWVIVFHKPLTKTKLTRMHILRIDKYNSRYNASQNRINFVKNDIFSIDDDEIVFEKLLPMPDVCIRSFCLENKKLKNY